MIEDDNSRINLHDNIGGLGKLFWRIIIDFIRRDFGYSDPFNFEPVFNLSWKKPQCLDIHRSAIETFFTIVFNGSYITLPGGKGVYISDKLAVEGSIFMIEVPRVGIDQYMEKIKIIATKCKLEELRMRKKSGQGNSPKQKLSILPVGKFCNIQKFKNLLIVEPNMNEPSFKKRADDLRTQLVEKIDFYSHPEISVDDKFIQQNSL